MLFVYIELLLHLILLNRLTIQLMWFLKDSLKG